MTTVAKFDAVTKQLVVREMTAEEESALEAERANAPPPPRRLVSKSLIISRLTDEQIAAGQALLDMTGNARLRARWYAADKPGVYADDADSRAMFAAIGADPDAVLAP